MWYNLFLQGDRNKTTQRGFLRTEKFLKQETQRTKWPKSNPILLFVVPDSRCQRPSLAPQDVHRQRRGRCGVTVICSFDLVVSGYVSLSVRLCLVVVQQEVGRRAKPCRLRASVGFLESSFDERLHFDYKKKGPCGKMQTPEIYSSKKKTLPGNADAAK